MTELQEKLFEQSESEYAGFQARVVPNIERNTIIGVRVPKLRSMASQLTKSSEYDDFIKGLPHNYYEENIIHAVIISKVKDYRTAVEMADGFLPFVDNWAVCDTMRPKAFEKHPDGLTDDIKRWISSDEEYTVRFGVDILMTYYLDDEFNPEHLRLVSDIKSDKYYVKMMIAWYFATALAKQWDLTVPVIEQCCLSDWIHNKTIQKACESFRIEPEKKAYLKGLKIK